MFDFAWSEIALIGVVALVLIGPKDLPVAIKTVSGAIKKMRRMAGEFQTHVDEMVREADLGEVRDQIRSIRSMDLRGEIERAVDADGSIRSTMNSDLMPPTTTVPPPPVPHTPAAEPAPLPEPALPGPALSVHAEPALQTTVAAHEVAVAEPPHPSHGA